MAKKSKASSSKDVIAGKQRTREHVIADLSVNYVERLVLQCGHVVQRLSPDYGYDLLFETFDESGCFEDGEVLLQIKATDHVARYRLSTEAIFSFPVSTREYRFWRSAVMPVLFVLFDAQAFEGYWLHIQEYEQVHQPKSSGRTMQLRIPRLNVLGIETIRIMRQRKEESISRYQRFRSSWRLQQDDKEQ